jgi:hypothetical protein
MGQKPPETSTDRYRRHAKELRAMAKQVTSEETRREMLIIAKQYEKLADDVGKSKRKS